jgi:phosphonate transport system substrate-binding protein
MRLILTALPWRALAVALAMLAGLAPGTAAAEPRGSERTPLRVMLIPADGGTASGTRADFAPLFNAITRDTGLHFDLKVGQSYSAVVEAMKSGLIDLAWFGPVAYVQAREAGAAELLAVSVLDGESVYYAGIFVPRDSAVTDITDLRGKSVAFGDINSGSSFTYQVAMMLDAGLDPARDLSAIRLTGSHAASLSALAEGQVDAACLSFESYLRAVNNGVIAPDAFRVLARSDAIPNPPMALYRGLPDDLKQRLRAAFGRVHESPDIRPELIRGYGGKRVDRYDAEFPESAFDRPAATLSRIGDDVRSAMLRKAGAR